MNDAFYRSIDRLCRTSVGRTILFPYLEKRFYASYNARNGDHLGFWLSKKSLPWHFWNQLDADCSLPHILKQVPHVSGTAVEIGFGIGKNYEAYLRHRFKRYVAVEPNRYLCKYLKNKFPELEVINSTVEDYTGNFDVLFCSNGVLLYLAPKTVDAFFLSLKKRGVKLIVVLNEGSPDGDIVKKDGTIFYDLRARTQNDYEHCITKLRPDGLYEYFVCY